MNSVQFSHSIMSNSLQPHEPQHARPPCPSLSWSLPKLMSIQLVITSNHLILCCPLLLLPSIFPNIMVFSSESALCIRWPKYWSFSSIISPFNEYSGGFSEWFQWFQIFSEWFPLGLTGLISLYSKGLSRVFSNTTVQTHQFFGAQLSHIRTWLLEKP